MKVNMSHMSIAIFCPCNKTIQHTLFSVLGARQHCITLDSAVQSSALLLILAKMNSGGCCGLDSDVSDDGKTAQQGLYCGCICIQCILHMYSHFYFAFVFVFSCSYFRISAARAA